MTKYFLLLFLTLLSATIINAQTPTRLVKETFGRYNTATGKYDIHSDTIHYTYTWGRGSNMKNNIISYDSAVYKQNNITVAGQYKTYDNLGRVKTRGGIYFSTNTDTLFYLSTNLEPDSLVSHFYFPNAVIHEKYSYDVSRNLIQLIRKRITNNNVYKDSLNYTYVSGNLTSIDHYTNYNNQGYILSGSITTTYNANNKPLVMIDRYNKRHSYTYNLLNDVIADTIFFWKASSSSWELDHVRHFIYDASRNIILDSPTWVPISIVPRHIKVKTSYNSNNDPLSKEYIHWDGNKWGGYFADSLRTYTYQTYNPTYVQDLSYVKLKAYPNPASTFLYFATNKEWGCKSYSIFDVTGRIHRHQNIANTIQNQHIIPIADLPNGIYILSVDTKEGRLQKTFIKK